MTASNALQLWRDFWKIADMIENTPIIAVPYAKNITPIEPEKTENIPDWLENPPMEMEFFTKARQ